jgi:hypothetical protein
LIQLPFDIVMGSREQKLNQFLFSIRTIALVNRKVLLFADRPHRGNISIIHPLGNTLPMGLVFLQWLIIPSKEKYHV